MFVQAVLVLLFATQIVAVPFQDKVTSLPFCKGNLGVQYSGYITVNATAGKALHYWFVESRGDPYNDPLILWLNGGPGCSSMDGFFYEQGPFHFDQNDDPLNLTLVDNPWTWTKLANVIFLEAPAGVGFSLTNVYDTNDNITADDNHRFIQNWLKAFPEYQGNDFYIAGESYAGIYVPTLAYRVAQDSSINFRGILVGNGVTDGYYDDLYNAFLPFLYGHALYSTTTQNEINMYCPNGLKPNGTLCNKAVQDAFQNMQDIDIYDIYSDCFHQRPNMLSHNKELQALLTQKKKSGGGVVPPCTDAEKATEYLNLPNVQDAIHVKRGITWAICTSSINYQQVVNSVLPIYRYLIAKRFRILVYSGDTDGAVPYTGTEGWVRSLSLPVKKLWKPWYIPKWDGKQV